MGTAEAVVQSIMAAIESADSVTDEQLSTLYFIFEKNLERALRILDQGGVQRVIAQPSQRSVFQVIGESKTGPSSYLCFPEHFCSCQSFFFDVVSRSDQLCCKHQLAAKLASSLHRCRDVTVSDAELAHLLLQC
ncbi:hypothetical protein M758_8G028000 [Ceratodon purpureus]|uniref:SWIM-type domain-containing protein n=1 Tax=Ceratodon purpureus TaxID=3225 RepID=A0A8T0GWY3_CERPU|nr:hypothetical protein KC19_8G029100 [Ceratodon purpureus]KAG0607433.1 hypothetical protein M758_8G028000 [Ceratodon purpureus]